jgi:hypothetical protein
VRHSSRQLNMSTKLLGTVIYCPLSTSLLTFFWWKLLTFTNRRKNICVGAPRTTCHTTQPDASLRIHSTANPLQFLRQRLGHTRGQRDIHDCSRSLAILPAPLIHGFTVMQQNGGDLFLKGKECPPNGPHQDLPQCPLPCIQQEHSRLMQVLHWRSPRKDLSFGQQHICGVLPREN